MSDKSRVHVRLIGDEAAVNTVAEQIKALFGDNVISDNTTDSRKNAAHKLRYMTIRGKKP